MPRRPFGSRIDRTVRLSASTDSGLGPTHHPKHGPHGGGPAATPVLTRGGRSLAMTSVGDRTADAAAAVRLANRPDGAPVSEHRFPGRVRRVSRNTALTGAALPPPPPSPAAAVLAMTSVGDRAADAAAAVRARKSTATLPRRESRSGAQLGHDGPPERAQLAGAWTGGLLADRGVNHDETTGRIDHDRLTAHAEEGEHRPLPREDPGLVAVAEERRRDARLDMTLLRPHASGLRDPGRRDDLSPPPVAVVREQQSQPRVVSQHRVDAAVGRFLACAIHEPRGVRLGAHRLPDLL